MVSNTRSLAVVLAFLAIFQHRTFVNAKAMQCIDKFEIFQNHTMCIADPTSSRDMLECTEIETKINNIRKNVQPAAKNMMEVEYSLALERLAQTWADTCSLDHDDPYYRFVPGRYSVGQNIYIGTNLSWSAVIDIWAKENDTFQYNNAGNARDTIGNYTQMVYAETVIVGCGKQKCGNLYFYVCNFEPQIDDVQLSQPYEKGDSNVGCHGYFSNSSHSLCSCIGKFCINGGTLNMRSCDCQCVPGVLNYDSHICELNCTPGGDHTDCNHMLESDCKTDSMVLFKCPWLCKICPYGGMHYRQGSVPMPWDSTFIPSTTTVSRKSSSTDHQAPRQQKIAVYVAVPAALFLVVVVVIVIVCIKKKWHAKERIDPQDHTKT